MAEGGRSLSQNEIDSLLSSIDQGEVEVGTHEEHAKKVVPYDFKRPERVARDQLRAIETLHEVFCRNIQAVMSGWLRSILDITVVSIDQLTYSEYINSLPNPTCFNVLSCEPLEGSFILEINPTVAFPIIERLLGSGRAAASPPERALTDLEWKLVERIITKIISGLQEVWTSVSPITLRVTGRESNPQLMPIMPPNEPVIAVKLEFSMAEYKGHINICIPVMSIEGVMDRISTHTWFVKKKDKGIAKHEVITETIAGAKLTVSAFLSEHIIRLGDLKALKEGDVIMTSHKEDEPLVLCVEGKPKYMGIPGCIKDKKAIRVLHKIPAKDHSMGSPRGYVRVIKRESQTEPETPSGDDVMVRNISHTPSACSVSLSEKTVHLNDILNLRLGTIIEFDKNIREPLVLEVGNVKLAKGSIVKIGEKFGFQVVDFVL